MEPRFPNSVERFQFSKWIAEVGTCSCTKYGVDVIMILSKSPKLARKCHEMLYRGFANGIEAEEFTDATVGIGMFKPFSGPQASPPVADLPF